MRDRAELEQIARDLYHGHILTSAQINDKSKLSQIFPGAPIKDDILIISYVDKTDTSVNGFHPRCDNFQIIEGHELSQFAKIYKKVAKEEAKKLDEKESYYPEGL